jgi:hypothetical protein
MKPVTRRSLAAAATVLAAVSAMAFQNRATWPGATTTLSLNTTSFPAGNPFTNNAQFAMSDWNAVTGSDFAYTTNSTDCGLSPLVTSDNCVFFTSGSNIGGALGLTSTSSLFGTMLDADVRFNVDASWTPDLNVGQFTAGAPFSFRGVARHEFGHALGLCHEDGQDNVVAMNSIYTAGMFLPANPHWDDRNAIRTLYPGNGTERDLIPYMWKKTSNGQVGCGQSSATVANPVANVTAFAVPGGTATIEFSFENAGNLASGNFDIDFLLSTNNIISTGDTLVGRNFGASAPAHSRGTFSRVVTIPAGTPLGPFFLGVCLDTGNAVPESIEFNNCALAPGTVQVVNVLPPPPPPPPVTLRVIRLSNGNAVGSVSSSPAGIACGSDCIQTYAHGTVVTLNLNPGAHTVADITGDDPDCLDGVVTMDRNKTCRVFFEDTTL